jgi:hypothetical protein
MKGLYGKGPSGAQSIGQKKGLATGIQGMALNLNG